MKHKAVLEWNSMGLIQEFVDDAPPPDEGRNFYKFRIDESLRKQLNRWDGYDDHAKVWMNNLCGAMQLGALPFPPALLFLFTIPIEMGRQSDVCSGDDAISLYKQTPLLLSGEQPKCRDAVLFSNWAAFREVAKQSPIFLPLWNWAIDRLHQNQWWVVTVDPSCILPERVQEEHKWPI